MFVVDPITTWLSRKPLLDSNMLFYFTPGNGVPYAHEDAARKINSLQKAQSQQSKNNTQSTFMIDHGIQATLNSDHLLLSLEVPGIKLNDLQVKLLEDGILHIFGERKQGNNLVSKLDKKFELKHRTLDTQHITASLSDGILMLKVPKKSEGEAIEVPLKTKLTPPQQNDKSFVIELDIPGVKLNDLKVCYKNGKLDISGQRKIGKDESISRSIQFDDEKFDATKSVGHLIDGVLTIVAPRKEEIKVKTTEIRINQGESISEKEAKREGDTKSTEGTALEVTQGGMRVETVGVENEKDD